MARNSADEKGENSNSEIVEEQEEEEEEEEALSLCDLPVSLLNEEIQSTNEEEQPKSLQTEQDFNFGSRGGSVLTESEMCAADEVFFQGQILPLRLSISSDSGVNPGSRSLNMSRSNSRSESMDHRYYSGVFSSRSSSSRSSSIGSRQSSTSTSTTNTTTTTKYKPKPHNQFHTHPSPKPQIRVSSLRHKNAGGRCRQSTMWDFFRLGLVRTPEIELQDLKLRTNINPSTNKNFGSQNSNSSSNSSGSLKQSKIQIIQGSNDGDLNMKKKRKQRFFAGDSAFLSGCKCSNGAVETVSSKIVIIKSGSTTRSCSNNERETHAIKEQLQQMTKEKRQQQQGKQTVSRHRTFEWLKELSLEAQLDDEA